jgi:hypothetical protein
MSKLDSFNDLSGGRRLLESHTHCMVFDFGESLVNPLKGGLV